MLDIQPDQNKGDVMGGGTSSVDNIGVVADFGHSNVVDESDIGIETECVKKMKRGQYHGWVMSRLPVSLYQII